MTVGSEWPELDRGYKLGSQDTPYKLALSIFKIKSQIDKLKSNMAWVPSLNAKISILVIVG